MILAAPPVAARVIVHDTTVVHDTLTLFAGRVPRMLDVNVHDALGGKDLVTLLVQSAVALLAAFLGAWIGGKMTRDAATRAIRDEWNLERQHATTRLRLRVENGLHRVTKLGATYKSHDSRVPLGPTVGEGLEVAWNLYYQVMEPVFTVGWGELADQIDEFFADCHTLAEDVKALEQEHRNLLVEKAGNPGGSTPINNYIAAHIVPRREKLRDRLVEMGEKADALHGKVRDPDIQVTVDTPKGRCYFDGIQKVFPVGRFLAARFSGHVDLAYLLIDDLMRSLRLPSGEAWYPRWVANKWRRSPVRGGPSSRIVTA